MGDLRQPRHPQQSQQSDVSNRDVSYAERTRTTWPQGRPFAGVLESAKSGDQQAIGILYRRFRPAVYRYVLSRVAVVAAAEDLTSETFYAMLCGVASTRAQDELTFVAWLLGIARNQVLMRFRRMKIHPEVELPPQYEDESKSVAEEDDPLLVLTARESWSETADAINQLTEEQRKVILFRVVLGYSTDEVANMMSRQPGTIRALQFRALNSLERYLHIHSETGTSENERNHADHCEG